ncbi:ribonuclease H-like domain-containing protein [Salipaludibacillus agaradhaerens]|uniref:Ribonuclease H-like domain-containing protein n=1 Tax=Salipaludibacillus agaradhaerens TaxID=76935 RepID=A0A9Q4B0Q5_SALAG|nr:ribonuclease H-like domain-containing protein [Salipaludibacillus agaradhaerens]MCR6096233.1 ribonuclease H-like domain-containing protein [Salipaludibacillus agaradhaerens]MCR6114208.1 ribonuclease H-like domain-containing protein [Salipaludibacillus agaradhaerens]
MSMKAKLLRMKHHLQLPEEKDQGELKGGIENEAPEPTDDETAFRALGFEPFYFENERAFRKRVIYPYESAQDKQLVEDMKHIHAFWQDDLQDHPLSFAGKPLDRLLFFDTETTGLSTGAGNVIFLIGYARLMANGVEVTQHLLESPASEAAFLSGFLDDFHEEDYLVSYNGKSFDWPQVKSRHAFIRKQLPKLPAFGHIDLLHSARRLWKDELPSCRLAIVEEHKLSLKREGDVPGSLAPLLYFEYLSNKTPHHLSGIIAHNDQDVRSLISLYALIAKKIIYPLEDTASAKEHVAIGAWFEKLKKFDWAERHFKQAIKRAQQPLPTVYYQLGSLYKKMKKPDLAVKYLDQALMEGTFPPIETWIERAKLAEHFEKDIDKAYSFAQQGLSTLKKREKLGHKANFISYKKDLNIRMKRLEKKRHA